MTENSGISGMLAYAALASKRDWSLSAYPVYSFLDGSSYRDPHVQDFYRKALGEVNRIGQQCISVSSPPACSYLSPKHDECMRLGWRATYISWTSKLRVVHNGLIVQRWS